MVCQLIGVQSVSPPDSQEEEDFGSANVSDLEPDQPVNVDEEQKPPHTSTKKSQSDDNDIKNIEEGMIFIYQSDCC